MERGFVRDSGSDGRWLELGGVGVCGQQQEGGRGSWKGGRGSCSPTPGMVSGYARPTFSAAPRTACTTSWAWPQPFAQTPADGKPVRRLLLCRPASSAPVAHRWQSGQAAACPIYLPVAPGNLLTPMAAVECLARRPRHMPSPPFRPPTLTPHPPLPPHPDDRCADADARVTSSLFAWTQPRRSAGHWQRCTSWCRSGGRHSPPSFHRFFQAGVSRYAICT